MVVLRDLLVLGVLDHLQHPEADRENREDDHRQIPQARKPDPHAPPVFGRGHMSEFYRRIRVLYIRRRSRAPGSSSASWKANTPTTAFPTPWPATAPYGIPNWRRSSSSYRPMKRTACNAVAMKNTTKRLSG